MTVALRMPTNILVRALWHGLDDTTFVGSFGVAISLNLRPTIIAALMRPRRPKQYCLQLYIYKYVNLNDKKIYNKDIYAKLPHMS